MFAFIFMLPNSPRKPKERAKPHICISSSYEFQNLHLSGLQFPTFVFTLPAAISNISFSENQGVRVI